MIKLIVPRKDGKKILLLGLSQKNLDRLTIDMPIKIDAEDLKEQTGLDMADVGEISIFAGPVNSTEQDLIDILIGVGLVPPDLE